jgi:3-deoxy-D-manno-octulosonic-acid transferase
MLRKIYTLSFYFLLPLIMLRLLWRSRKLPAYRRRMQERLGYFTPPPQTGGLWVHAVSLGEVIAAAPLIAEFQRQHPNDLVTVTTITPSGSDRVQKLLGGRVFHVYLPYDTPGMLTRFVAKITPRLCVIMETELWPNLLHTCRKRHIPVLLANGRMSARSASRYARIASVTREMLQTITFITAQTAVERSRYIELGANPDKVVVTGSIKFDITLPGDLPDRAAALSASLGTDRLKWIAASTHEGEETQVLAAFARVREIFPEALLILVPRHPDRFKEVAQLCQKQGFQVTARSTQQDCTLQTDIFLGDTIGELLLFYAVADVAFVGGSLTQVGGHNLLEPAALARPVITGPYMDNFLEITRLLLAAKAVKQIHHSQELAEAVVAFLSDGTLRAQTGQAGLQVVENNRGALARQAELMLELYGSENIKLLAPDLTRGLPRA